MQIKKKKFSRKKNFVILISQLKGKFAKTEISYIKEMIT